MARVGVLLALILGLLGSHDLRAQTPSFELKSKDRVVFLGNGFIEHAQVFSFLEARLARRMPEGEITFRNLGWGGDTVSGSARTSGFQNPDGINRLFREVKMVEPTVLMLGYGMNESWGGEAGLPFFIASYDYLLKILTPLKARLVILSPTFQEDLGRPFPDPAPQNRNIEMYVAALKSLAEKRGLPYIDLYHPLVEAKKADPKRVFTTNGILLNEAGYALLAGVIEEKLGLPVLVWNVELDAAGKLGQIAGTKIDEVRVQDKSLRFRATDLHLPAPQSPWGRLLVTGLETGEYDLKIDGQTVLRASAAELEKGISLTKGPGVDQTEKLRDAFAQMNDQFFRRWRPYNDHSRHWTFIGGDFKLFDDEVARRETTIATLRRPTPHTFEILGPGIPK